MKPRYNALPSVTVLWRTGPDCKCNVRKFRSCVIFFSCNNLLNGGEFYCSTLYGMLAIYSFCLSKLVTAGRLLSLPFLFHLSEHTTKAILWGICLVHSRVSLSFHPCSALIVTLLSARHLNKRTRVHTRCSRWRAHQRDAVVYYRKSILWWRCFF